MTSVTVWAPTQGVQYASKYQVKINSNLSQGGNPHWGQNARQIAIAHELGHVYGLGEQYYRNHVGQSACYAGSTSVMDAFYDNGGAIIPCDASSPQPVDIDYARYISSVGGLWDWGVVSPPQWPNPNQAQVWWNDYGWAESLQIVDVWYLPPGGGVVRAAQHVRYDDIGWKLGWALWFLFDRTAAGTPGGPNDVYAVCGSQWFNTWGAGPYTCQPTEDFWTFS